MKARGAVPLLLAVLVVGACASQPSAVASPEASRKASPSPSKPPPSFGPAPVLGFDPPRDTSQGPRYVAGRWTSTLPLLDVQFAVTPEPSFPCSITIDPDRQSGGYRCDGLLPPSTDVRLDLMGSTPQSVRARAARNFRTMGERLSAVPWFTEFEDPNGDALACAAASVRIVQVFTTGRDPLNARQILARAKPLNKSADPGTDPAAIAAVITGLEPTNRYHYYRYPTREEATRAAVYWLARSAKPVIALSLAGQHAPVIVGYSGTAGSSPSDPGAKITSLVIEDPQRGDLDPLTAAHRPDKSRSRDFQVGAVIPIEEWYADDWWFRDAYKGSIVFNSDGRVHDVDRNDRVYPRPHWDGTFVILVDDGDTATAPDREGQVTVR
jgi:hypothetical protein